jgi:hypothetical protein
LNYTVGTYVKVAGTVIVEVIVPVPVTVKVVVVPVQTPSTNGSLPLHEGTGSGVGSGAITTGAAVVPLPLAFIPAKIVKAATPATTVGAVTAPTVEPNAEVSPVCSCANVPAVKHNATEAAIRTLFIIFP